MEWNVVQTEPFETWFLGLTGKEQAKLLAAILQLKALGPTLPFPLSSAIKGARHALRELRIQVDGQPYRILYAFDPERSAVLLVGGDKTGDARWYKRAVHHAEHLFDEHLASLKEDDNGGGEDA